MLLVASKVCINEFIHHDTMAAFETNSYSKCHIDDTEKLVCVIENAQNINKHTVSIT